MVTQGDRNYEAAKAFWINMPLDEAAETVLRNLDDIPYEIRPIYSDGI